MRAHDDKEISLVNLPADDVRTGSDAQRIGEILHAMGAISAEQIQQVLSRQASNGRVFGETAIEMGFVGRDEVIAALSRQFSYPYQFNRGDVQMNDELVMANSPFSEEVECFRNLRSELLMGVLAPANTSRPALAVVSPNIGDGKSFVIANLAIAFSQARSRTLLIDADMRSPRLHEVFGIENGAGLSNALSGRSETRIIAPVAALPNLYMIPSGTLPPNPTELIHSPAFEILLHEVTKKFDVVLVDTPAAIHGADAAVIASKAGAAMVVARKGASRVASLQGLLARLGKANIRIAGVMMNVI